MIEQAAPSAFVIVAHLAPQYLNLGLVPQGGVDQRRSQHRLYLVHDGRLGPPIYICITRTHASAQNKYAHDGDDDDDGWRINMNEQQCKLVWGSQASIIACVTHRPHLISHTSHSFTHSHLHSFYLTICITLTVYAREFVKGVPPIRLRVLRTIVQHQHKTPEERSDRPSTQTQRPPGTCFFVFSSSCSFSARLFAGRVKLRASD